MKGNRLTCNKMDKTAVKGADPNAIIMKIFNSIAEKKYLLLLLLC